MSVALATLLSFGIAVAITERIGFLIDLALDLLGVENA